jgi:branched-chain amino acid transport system substrate-binding protein
MTTYIQNLKSAGVDTLLAWQTNLPNMTAAFKALSALGWNPTFIGSSLGIAVGPVVEAAGPAQTAKTYTIQLKPWTRAPGQKLGGKQREFFERVRVIDGAKGRELGVAGQSLYDFVMLLGETINKIGTDDPTKVKEALEQVTGYEGMGGTFTFTPQLHSGLTQESITLGSLGSLSEPESEGFFMARIEP